MFKWFQIVQMVQKVTIGQNMANSADINDEFAVNEVVAFEKEPRNIYVTKWKALRSALPIFLPASDCQRLLLPEGMWKLIPTLSPGSV